MNKNKSTKTELNEMVVAYQRTHSSETFANIYEEVAQRCFGKESYHARRWSIDESDIHAMQDDELLKMIEVYDANHGDFENLLNSTLTKRRIDLVRRRQTRTKYETLVTPAEDEADSEAFDRLAYGSPTAATEGTADPAEELMKQKRSLDQRQLIEALLENLDASTAKIVEAILSDRTLKRDFNATAIANEVQVDRTRIKRKLRNLSKKYDSSTHGDYREYLCV